MKKLSTKFIERGHDAELVEEEINKARQQSRTDLLKPKEAIETGKNILTVTYNKNLPNLKKAINDNWNILSINHELAPIFQDKPILAFRRNPNLQNLLCHRKLKNNKPIVPPQINHQGKCSPCLSQGNNKCCKQMVSINHF